MLLKELVTFPVFTAEAIHYLLASQVVFSSKKDQRVSLTSLRDGSFFNFLFLIEQFILKLHHELNNVISSILLGRILVFFISFSASNRVEPCQVEKVEPMLYLLSVEKNFKGAHLIIDLLTVQKCEFWFFCTGIIKL